MRRRPRRADARPREARRVERVHVIVAAGCALAVGRAAAKDVELVEVEVGAVAAARRGRRAVDGGHRPLGLLLLDLEEGEGLGRTRRLVGGERRAERAEGLFARARRERGDVGAQVGEAGEARLRNRKREGQRER